jgi:hypothetical protein
MAESWSIQQEHRNRLTNWKRGITSRKFCSNYPAAMVVVSHDGDFLKEIKIEKYYEI